MSAPFRVVAPPSQPVATRGPTPSGVLGVTADASDEFKNYLERLLKFIPGEVIGLYLVGSGFIPKTEPLGQAIWGVVCFIAVIAVRAFATADPANHEAPVWIQVAISCISFLIWMYSIGGPFAAYGVYVPYIGSLLVLAWTFFVPLFYKGVPS